MKNTTSLVIQTLSHYDALHIEFVVNGNASALPMTESFWYCNYTTKTNFSDFIAAQHFPSGCNTTCIDLGQELSKALITISSSQSNTCHQLLMLLTDVPVTGKMLEEVKELQNAFQSNIDISTFLFGDLVYNSSSSENTEKLSSENGGKSFLVNDTHSMDEAVSSYYLPYTEQMYDNVTWTYDSNPFCGGSIVMACTPAYNNSSQLIGVVCVGIEQNTGISVSAIVNSTGIINSYSSFSLAKHNFCMFSDLKNYACMNFC